MLHTRVLTSPACLVTPVLLQIDPWLDYTFPTVSSRSWTGQELQPASQPASRTLAVGSACAAGKRGTCSSSQVAIAAPCGFAPTRVSTHRSDEHCLLLRWPCAEGEARVWLGRQLPRPDTGARPAPVADVARTLAVEGGPRLPRACSSWPFPRCPLAVLRCAAQTQRAPGHCPLPLRCIALYCLPQKWYLLHFYGDDSEIDLSHNGHPGAWAELLI